MILGLDTTQNAKANFVLWDRKGDVIKSVTEKFEPRQTEETLDRLMTFLLQEECAFSDVEGIIVAKGPGAFTALRVGVTIANALAYAGNIPVLGVASLEDVTQMIITELLNQRPGKSIEPEYGREPHIT